MAKHWTVVLLAILFMLGVDSPHAWSQSAATTSIIPAERNFAWNPGLMSKGGIPNRTQTCATLAAGSSQTAIQAALDNCPAGQVVQLAAGTYTVNNLLLVHSGITLRGAGAGQTVLVKTNGALPRTSTVDPGTKGILTAEL